MPKSIKQALQSLIDSRASEWLDPQVVRLGKDSTQLIETGKPGVLWARLRNGKPIPVYVGSADVPSRFNLRLLGGRRRSQPKIWYLISTLEDYDEPAGGGELTYHRKQHEEQGGDRLNLSWKQIVARSVRVKSAEDFVVRVFGDPDLTPNGWVLIPTEDMDLSSYVPATGALFVAIESDDDGALDVNDGTPFAAPGVGTEADYPVPTAGKYTRAQVLLFEGQTSLLDEHIIIPKPPSFNPANYSDISHVHALDDIIDVNAPSPTHLQVLTFNAYTEEWYPEDPPGDSGFTQEEIEDIVGAMVAGNTETGITVTYDDATGKYNFSVTPASVGAIPNDGWAARAETWTRTGNYAFEVSGDLTAVFRKGTKIRYKDGGAFEYGIVLSSSHAAGTTTVTLFTNDDYAMAAATITDKYISHIENPEGFPHWFNFANTIAYSANGSMTFTSVAATYARFRAIPGGVEYEVFGTGTTGGTASTQIQASVPGACLDTNPHPAACATRDAASGLGTVGAGGVNGNTAVIFARKSDNSNYGLGTGRFLQVAGFYPF